MRKIILGLLILVCSLFLLVQTTAKAETDPESFECLETLTGHSNPVWSVAFSPNYECLASGSSDNTIKIWYTSDWSEIKTLTEHSDDVYCVAFSQNNKWLASGSYDDTIKIWDTSDWGSINTLSGHSNPVWSVAFSPNNEWLASGSSDNTIKIWNTTDWSEIKTLTEHSENVYGVSFSTNNKWLASGSSDNTIKIWNTSDWTELETLSEHSSWVYSVAFSPNNERLASGSDDNTVKIWNTSDWSELETLTEHSDDVFCVVFSQNNKWLASGSYDDTIKILDTSDWGSINTLTEHSDDVVSIAFSPNNERIASGSRDNIIKIWGSLPDLDLTLTSSDISLSKENITTGDNVTIDAEIHNIGSLNATNVTVNFYDEEVFIGNDTIDILKGETETASIEWIVLTCGNRTIYVKIDEKDLISEENETNNLASNDVNVRGADLNLTSSDISLSKENITTGDNVTIYAEIHNIGILNATNVNVSFYEGGPPSIDSNKVAMWHMDEGSGDNIYDASPNSNEGTIYGATWTEGKYNNALSFDGIDDYIIVDKEFIGEGDYSFSSWFKLNDPNPDSTGYVILAVNDNEDLTNSKEFHILFGDFFGHDDSLLVLLDRSNNENQMVYSPDNIISDTKWHHVGVNLYENDKMELYLDGIFINSVNIEGDIGDITPTRILRIGAGWHNGEIGNFFNGTIDEVTIYNRVLQAEEIKVLYEGKLIGNDTIYVQAGEIETASIEWDVQICCNRSIYVMIDKEDLIPEENETNNIASIDVNVRGADLTLSSNDISFSNENIIYNETVTIYSEIHNIGLVNSTNVNVSFYEGGVPFWNNNTVAMWHMDEGSGDKIYDVSLNCNDGNLIDGPTWVEGKYGKALKFDGEDDYVYIQTPSSLRVDYYTVSVWIKSSTSTDRAGVFSGGYKIASNNHCGYELILNETGFARANHMTRPTGNFGAFSYQSVIDNTWHHLVVTWDGESSNFYMDGKLSRTFHVDDIGHSYRPGPIYWDGPHHDFYIGKRLWSQESYFNGIIDEVAIYNRALTKEEIKVLYEGYKLIGNDTINVLAGKTETASIEWNVQTVGDTPIYVKIDEDDLIPEENETNNIAEIDIFVRGVDLTLSSNDISFSNENIIVGDIVTIYAEIHNIGVLDTTSAVVNFYYEDELIGNDTIDVLFGETETASIEWEIPSSTGTHTIYAKIDEEIKIMEENETNNIAIIKIQILPKFLPSLLTENNKKTTYPNQEVTYTSTVTNFGGKDDTIYLSYSSTKTWLCFINKTVVFLKYSETANISLTVIPPYNAEAEESLKIFVTVTSNGNTSRTDIITITTTIEQIHDFKISTDMTTYYGNPGEMVNWTYIIENIGNGEDKVILSFNSSASSKPLEWIFNPNEDKKWLEIGEIWNKKYYISISENAKTGEEAIIVFDISSDLLENEILGSITIIVKTNKISNINIEPETEILITDPNKVTSYNITITNNGNAEETFDLMLSGKSSEWADWNKQELTLIADEQKEITINITPENSALQGESILKLYAVQNTNILSSYDVTIIVKQTHAVEMEAETLEGFIYPGESIDYQIKIINLGNKNDTIELRLSGENSDWASLDETVFDLNYNEYKYAKLKVTVPTNAKAMDIPDIKIEAYSNNISLGFLEISAEVKQIYNISLTIEKKESEVNQGQSVYYEIKIINNGNGYDIVSLELSGLNSNWGYLNESIFEIGPCESKIITLTVNSPRNGICSINC